jgi:hypothetical protein
MKTQNAVHDGNEKSGSRGIIKDAAVPQYGGKAEASGDPAGSAIPFQRGTTDIILALKDGQMIKFDGDNAGILQSQLYFDKHAKRIVRAHFGASCWYFRDGRGVAMVNMSRDEFFRLVKP